MLDSENIAAIRAHLDSAGPEYLDAINETTPEGLLLATEKMQPLKDFLKTGEGVVVSVGVGQGEEIHALHELFKDTDTYVVGIDISHVALERAAQRIRKNNLRAALLDCHAAQTPFPECSVKGMVYSSVLHEIASYHSDSIEALNLTLGGGAKALEDGGVIFIRDFAAPSVPFDVEITLRDEMTAHFYDYFASHFRSFGSWGEIGSRIRDKGSERYFPSHIDGDLRLTMSLDRAGELLLHYRNFWNDMQRGYTYVGDRTWKDLDERYYIQDAQSTRPIAMSPEHYSDAVLESVNKTLAEKGSQLEVVMITTDQRPETSAFLAQHFDLRLPGAAWDATEELIDQVTRKMTLAFRKTIQDTTSL